MPTEASGIARPQIARPPISCQEKDKQYLMGTESRCRPGKNRILFCSTAAFFILVASFLFQKKYSGKFNACEPPATGTEQGTETRSACFHESDLDHKRRAWILQ